MTYLVCYDIADAKRLRQVAKILENHGLRVQKSFFQCDVDREKLRKIRDSIRQIIDPEEDSFFIYPICDECNRNALKDGTGELLVMEPFEIL